MSTQSQAGRLQSLIEANRALAAIDSLEELLPELLRLAQDVTNAEGSSILLYKASEDALEFTLALNDSNPTAAKLAQSGILIPMGQGIAGHVAQHRESLNIKDAYLDERFFKKADKATGYITRSLLCVPVTNHDALLGVVQTVNAKQRDNFDAEDLAILESFAALAAVALVRADMLEATLRQERLQAQLDIASRIQSYFLPTLPDLSPSAGLWAATRPAVHVGGDFYDCIPLDDGSLLLTVVDVSGKGLPAALVATTLWTRLRSAAARLTDPGELLTRLNNELCALLKQELFATATLLRFWPTSGKVSVASAAHPAPMRVDGAACVEMELKQGMPLGVSSDEVYTESHIELISGESLVLLTDGVTEARAPSREFFGEARACEAVIVPTTPRGPHLFEAVQRWCGETSPNDDITVLEIWRQ